MTKTPMVDAVERRKAEAAFLPVGAGATRGGRNALFSSTRAAISWVERVGGHYVLNCAEGAQVAGGGGPWKSGLAHGSLGGRAPTKTGPERRRRRLTFPPISQTRT